MGPETKQNQNPVCFGKGRRRVFVSVVMIIIIVLMMMKGGANCDSRSFLVDGDRLSGFSIPL